MVADHLFGHGAVRGDDERCRDGGDAVQGADGVISVYQCCECVSVLFDELPSDRSRFCIDGQDDETFSAF